MRKISKPHSSDKKNHGNLPRAFQAMCRNHNVLVTDNIHGPGEEEDYERGCNRLAGCISAGLFDVVMTLSKVSRCEQLPKRAHTTYVIHLTSSTPAVSACQRAILGADALCVTLC